MSRLQPKVLPATVEVKLNVAVVLFVIGPGDEVIEVSGGVALETVIPTEAVLLAKFESASLASTLNVVMIVPGWFNITRIATVAVEPFGIVPRLQMIKSVPKHPPWLTAKPTKVTPGGKSLVSITPVASSGPFEVKSMTYLNA